MLQPLFVRLELKLHTAQHWPGGNQQRESQEGASPKGQPTRNEGKPTTKTWHVMAGPGAIIERLRLMRMKADQSRMQGPKREK